MVKLKHVSKIISTGNRILADEAFCELHHPGDWEYEGEEAEAAPSARTLTKLGAMNLFTDDELAGIYSAAKVNVGIEVWLEKFKAAQDVNLDDPRFRGGINALESVGLLPPGRAAQILA